MTAQDDVQKAVSSPSRSPSYPFIDLQEAIARTRKFYDQEGKAPAPLAAAVKHWGYSEKSSGGRQTVATLLHYGLLKEEGSGDSRRISVSKMGLDILLREQGTPEWVAAIRASARAPKLFAELLSKYEATGLPSDSTLKHYLIAERDLTPTSADAIVKNLRSNIRYANLDGSDQFEAAGPTVSSVQQESSQKDKPEVGDLIQWESGGLLIFESPRRVRAIQNFEGADWVFVEGSTTGIPVGETVVESRDKNKSATQAPMLPITSEEVPLMSAERELLRGPLSKDTGYRLLVQGKLGSKEIGKLIRLLEAQRLVLDDDD